MTFDETDWLAYREANSKFADAVYHVCRSGDIVWVQDYHRRTAATLADVTILRYK